MRHGILLIDKPSGPTSHDVVEIVRHTLGIRKVGHMGTLDPLATGLLLLGIGEGTKLTPFLSGLDKTYECSARLGAWSSTYDALGTLEPVGDPAGLARQRIEESLARFRGTIDQLPPPFSAVKVEGQPLYKYARKGKDVERKPRRVRVYELQLAGWKAPDLELRMRVGSGTYVRSVVHDLGEALEVGAHVISLRRTAIGAFDVKQATPVALDGAIGGGLNESRRSLAAAVAHLTHIRVADTLVEAVRNGGTVTAHSLEPPARTLNPDDVCALVDANERLLAIARCRVNREEIKVAGVPARRGDLVLKPLRVFHDE